MASFSQGKAGTAESEAVDASTVASAVRLCFAGDVEPLRELLAASPAVAIAKDASFNDSSPLHVAIGENEEACALAIIDACAASVRARDVEARTPLHHVGVGTSRALVEAVVAAGAEVDAADARGLTPLLYAVDAMACDAVDALLAAGADPSKGSSDTTASSVTPLDVAAGKRRIDDDPDDEDDDDDEEDAPLTKRNHLIYAALAARLGGEEGVPSSDDDADWFARDDLVPDLGAHDVSATVFEAPTARDKDAPFKLTLTVVSHGDDDEDDDDEDALIEVVVRAHFLAASPDGARWRCYLAETDPRLADDRPDLLLVRGRELVVSVSSPGGTTTTTTTTTPVEAAPAAS